MKPLKRTTRPKLRPFQVGYYVEQGFTITLSVASAANAERIIKKRLDYECDVLKGSTRVHYDGGTVSVDEVRS